MEYTQLGKTDLDVSVLGLGAGGPNRLGVNSGKPESEIIGFVDEALDLGINFIDTAEYYGTEPIIGNAIAGHSREDLVLSTKYTMYEDGELRSPDELEESLNNSLEKLGTDYIDIYHLHAVRVEDYEYAVDELRPRLEAFREEGKIRNIGITEAIDYDTDHKMLSRAVNDDVWDVMMVGYNLLNQSAGTRVLDVANSNEVGTICMAAVRRTLPDPAALTETINELIGNGELSESAVDSRDPFGFLIHDDGATNIFDAAYRFCRYNSSIDTVLSGTSSPGHLRKNVKSVQKGPLPDEDVERVKRIFGEIDSVI